MIAVKYSDGVIFKLVVKTWIKKWVLVGVFESGVVLCFLNQQLRLKERVSCADMIEVKMRKRYLVNFFWAVAKIIQLD